MHNFFKACVDLYLELAPGAKLHPATTPFLAEDHRDSPARGPAGSGPVEECPWCCHTFAPNPYASVSELERARKAKRVGGTGSTTPAKPACGVAGNTADRGSETDEGEARGRLAPIAAKILMKILYGARSARLDLLRAVSHLACYFTKWTSRCDRQLYRLVGYMKAAAHIRMVGWVGDRLD